MALPQAIRTVADPAVARSDATMQAGSRSSPALTETALPISAL
jgi:hypothetical protein